MKNFDAGKQREIKKYTKKKMKMKKILVSDYVVISMFQILQINAN